MKSCLFLFNSMSPFSRKKVYGGEVHLMDYFPAIKKMHPEKDVEGKEYFNQLNRVRIHIKHHGLFPDQKQWYRVGEKTYDYVSRWCENYFNVSLDDLDESSLIHD